MTPDLILFILVIAVLAMGEAWAWYQYYRGSSDGINAIVKVAAKEIHDSELIGAQKLLTLLHKEGIIKVTNNAIEGIEGKTLELR